MARDHRARVSIVTVGAGGRAAVLALVAGLALGACGDDEPDEPSKEQYVRAIDRVCAGNAEELESINELTIQGKKAETWEMRFFVEELGPALEVMMLQLRQLEKPEDDVPDAARLLSIYDGLIADSKRAAKSDRGSVAFVASLDSRIELIDDAARSVGAPSCGGDA